MEPGSNYQALVPYFMVQSAPKFFAFAKAVFNAELIHCKTRDNSEDVIHAEMNLAGIRIYVADSGFCGGEWISASSGGGACRSTDGGKPIQMFLHVENADETHQKAVAAGGVIAMAPCDDDGGRMCGIVDPSENLWWIKSPP
jgi:uncharacterized glyoxalase superfamily protein PhnB